MKKHYKARWAQAGKPSVANVSLDANSDHSAKQQFDRIARELGVTNTPRTITEGGRTVESLTKGTTQ